VIGQNFFTQLFPQLFSGGMGSTSVDSFDFGQQDIAMPESPPIPMRKPVQAPTPELVERPPVPLPPHRSELLPGPNDVELPPHRSEMLPGANEIPLPERNVPPLPDRKPDIHGPPVDPEQADSPVPLPERRPPDLKPDELNSLFDSVQDGLDWLSGYITDTPEWAPWYPEYNGAPTMAELAPNNPEFNPELRVKQATRPRLPERNPERPHNPKYDTHPNPANRDKNVEDVALSDWAKNTKLHAVRAPSYSRRKQIVRNGGVVVNLDTNAAIDPKTGETLRRIDPLIIIPDNATKAQRKAARAYVEAVGDFIEQHTGRKVARRVRTRSQNGNVGRYGTMHTEPFAVADDELASLFESDMGAKAYAGILRKTLGRIPGVEFAVPHGGINSTKKGAVWGDRNEVSIARKHIQYLGRY